MRKIEPLTTSELWKKTDPRAFICDKLNEVIAALNEKADEPDIRDGASVWYISADGFVSHTIFDETMEFHSRMFRFGNMFPTEEEANEAAKKVQELLLSLRK